MKIVAHTSASLVRGAENQLELIVSGLQARGHNVVVCCNPRSEVDERLRALGIRTVPERPRGDLNLIAALQFARRLRREKPDALLLTSWALVHSAGWAARRARVPRVVLRLGVMRGIPTRRVRGWKYSRAFDHYIDAIIVNSRAVRDRLASASHPYPADRIHLIHNAARPPVFKATDLRGELGLAPTDKLILGVGGLEHRKGFDLLIAAGAALPAHVHLAIAGSGPLQSDLAAQAAAAGMQARVHLLGQRADVADMLAKSDAFALTSRNEGFSVALLEAMAAGIPIVATSVAGAEDALAQQDGHAAAGLIVPVDDVDALQRALASVLSEDASGIKQRAAEARRRIEEWFSQDRMVEEYERVLAG